MTADDRQVDALADLLLAEPPDLETSGEWGRTVARGYARRIIAAGWRPPDPRLASRCPFCHAKPGEACRVYAGGRYGRPLKWPHNVRRPGDE
jgi:hypothetical protein